MPVEKYRSIEDMPPPWRDRDDPENLRAVARALTLHRALAPRERCGPSVRHFRNLVEMNEDRGDPLRLEDPRLGEPPGWARERPRAEEVAEPE